VARPRPGAFRGRKLLLPWVAAAVLLGALVVTGRLLDADDRAGAPAGPGPTRTGGATDPTARPAGTVEIEGVSLVPTTPRLPGNLPAGRRPARIRRPLPGTAAHPGLGRDAVAALP
jgi:hypothetical protein